MERVTVVHDPTLKMLDKYYRRDPEFQSLMERAFQKFYALRWLKRQRPWRRYR